MASRFGDENSPFWSYTCPFTVHNLSFYFIFLFLFLDKLPLVSEASTAQVTD